MRIESIEALDSDLAENQVILKQLAFDDQDVDVRVAAIARITDAKIIKTLLQENLDSSGQSSYQHSPTHTAALARLEVLLADNAIDQTAAISFLQAEPQQQAAKFAVVFACSSSEEPLRAQAIELIDSEAGLIEVVQKSRFHDSRLLAASKLKQDDNIRIALQACKSRDKVVAKQLQQRLDQKASAEAAKLAAAESVDTCLKSMQLLSENVWSPQTSSKRTVLLTKWQSLDSELTGGKKDQFDSALAKVDTLIEKHVAKSRAQDASNLVEQDKQTSTALTQGRSGESPALDTEKVSADKTQTVSAAQAANVENPVAGLLVDDEVNSLLSSLGALKTTEFVPAVLSATKPSTDSSQQLLAHMNSVAVMFDPPFEIAKGRPQAIEQRIKRVAVLLDTDKLLPGLPVKESQYIQDLVSHHDALEQRLDKAKQESTDRIKATHRQFAALSGIIGEGKWGPASSMFRRLQKKVNAMESGERSTLTDKLSRAEKQLDEMGDWQDFAARPKLEALCDEMEALPAKELKPDALAREIKSLQSKWKSLGVSRAANELWSRFKEAGDTAYEPCRSYFEQKQTEREAKLKTKASLCDQLHALNESTDWDEVSESESVEWKKIQTAVNNAKRDWSRNRIQDRKPDVALEKRFSEVLKPLETRLSSQYEANAAIKQDLVEKVQKLAEAEINQHSANQAKSLQSAWKQVGIMRRKDDQALWESFNGHCRTIFKHQHAVQKEKYQASMSHVFRARDIIKVLKQIAKSGNFEEQKIHALQAEFQALEEFPEKDKKFLKRDFRAAMDACGKLQESAAKKRARAEKDEIARLVQLCEQLEAAVEIPSSAGATLNDDVMHAWDNTESSLSRELNTKMIERRDRALKHIEAGTTFDYEKAETTRRELLIRMEILADKETPAEDKAQRMQYQLTQLSEGMTSSSVMDKRSAMAELEQQWYAAEPVKQSSKDSFQSRFLAVLDR